MFFDAEHKILLFEHHTDSHIKSFILVSESWVVGIFHETTCKFVIFFNINLCFNKISIEVFEEEEFTSHIHHRTSFTLSSSHSQARNTCFFSHECVISTKCWRNMHDTSTIFGCYIVTLNYTECTFTWVYPRDKLFIFRVNQINTHTFANYAIRHEFVTRFVVFHCHFSSFWIEKRSKQWFCHDICSRNTCVWIKTFYCKIFNFWTNTKSCI